jgi:radical SAM protein with 4Fe4S-binding SPASM domain
MSATTDISRETEPAPPDPYDTLFRGRPDAGVFRERASQLSSDEPRQWEAIAFPLELGVELAAMCNLACVMCPVPTTKRPKELMEPALFHRIVDQVATEKGFVLMPQGFGETMLHAQWADLLRYARKHGINGPVVMLTNGTALNDKNVRRILELGIEALIVSIDGTTPETYAAVRVGGDLAKVEANVNRLLAARGTATTPRVCVRIIRMADTEDEIQAFFDRWRPRLLSTDQILINEYNDWAGKVDDLSDKKHAVTRDRPRTPCRMLWRNLSVHADGKVSACCHDSEDELIVGDLRAGDTLQAIWTGERLRNMRRIHLEGRIDELPICKSCKVFF